MTVGKWTRRLLCLGVGLAGAALVGIVCTAISAVCSGPAADEVNEALHRTFDKATETK